MRCDIRECKKKVYKSNTVEVKKCALYNLILEGYGKTALKAINPVFVASATVGSYRGQSLGDSEVVFSEWFLAEEELWERRAVKEIVNFRPIESKKDPEGEEAKGIEYVVKEAP